LVRQLIGSGRGKKYYQKTAEDFLIIFHRKNIPLLLWLLTNIKEAKGVKRKRNELKGR
jgi:hypothetical protein